MVSVIIPNYNHAIFLKKRIESVLNQSYNDFEVIILDDCSTDDSKRVIEEYSDHWKVAHIVINETNSGSPFIQWQKGFELAKGDYVWIAESDDYADPEFLSTAITLFEANTTVGLFFCDSNVVDAGGIVHIDYYKKFRNRNFNTEKWNYNYISTGIKEVKDHLIFDCTINNMSATVFKKKLLSNVKFYQLNKFKYCGDWYFLLALAMQTDIGYIANSLNYFRYGTNNFKKGTRSALNYHRERALVKYYLWDELKWQLSGIERKKAFQQLADEMKIQINEAIKGQSSFLETFKMMKELRSINSSLFNSHLKKSLSTYLWKN
ncbi:MAG: glycosyltransferase [Bacteroidota bacterium]|nr:glycosyltransferase [Bacteroidota bacterium]